MATDIKVLAEDLVKFVSNLTNYQQVMVMILDDDGSGLKFGAITNTLGDTSDHHKLERADHAEEADRAEE
jgi:hypothetical protein